MIPTSLTLHSQRRLQQRSIPAFVLDLLERFGSDMRCGGADRLFFDKAARKRLAAHFGSAPGLVVIERWLGVYAVVGDNGHIVTVGHQTRRFRRP